MFAKIISGLVVLGIVAYFMMSLGTKAHDAPKSAAVSKLQNELQEQRQQIEGLDVVKKAPQPE